MLEALVSKQIGAIDIGSGTIKLSIFAVNADKIPGVLELHEIDTQLRRGMGPKLVLQDAPVALSLNAVAVLKRRAADFNLSSLAVYATSAVRRASNPQILLDPLFEEFGLTAVVLTEAQEARLNLLGTQLKTGTRKIVTVDPGGDSTDCAWLDKGNWDQALWASLPFGSVALAEKYSAKRAGDHIPAEALEEARDQVIEKLETFEAAKGLKGREPAIRMNEPMRRALETFGSAPDKNGAFLADAPWQTAQALAMMSHSGRMQALAGEAEGKVDRTPFGYASWAGLLTYMEAKKFTADPWGIKLGACVAAALGLGPWEK